MKSYEKTKLARSSKRNQVLQHQKFNENGDKERERDEVTGQRSRGEAPRSSRTF